MASPARKTSARSRSEAVAARRAKILELRGKFLKTIEDSRTAKTVHEAVESMARYLKEQDDVLDDLQGLLEPFDEENKELRRALDFLDSKFTAMRKIAIALLGTKSASADTTRGALLDNIVEMVLTATEDAPLADDNSASPNRPTGTQQEVKKNLKNHTPDYRTYTDVNGRELHGDEAHFDYRLKLHSHLPEATGREIIARLIQGLSVSELIENVGTRSAGAVVWVRGGETSTSPTEPVAERPEVLVNTPIPTPDGVHRGAVETQTKYPPYPVDRFEQFIDEKFTDQGSKRDIFLDCARVNFYDDFDGEFDHDTLTLEDLDAVFAVLAEFRKS